MNTDPLLQMIDSTLGFHTHEILRDFGLLAYLSDDPQKVINRFMVQTITHCKDSQNMPYHELLLIELMDTKFSGSNPHFVILERTASDKPSSSLDQPDNQPDNPSLTEIMIKKFKEAPAAVLASFLKSKEHLGLTPYQPLINELDTSSPNASKSQLGFFDTASLAATRAARASTHSVCDVYLADDMFRGGKSIEVYARSIHNMRQLKPLGLTFFEFAILADAVHKYKPRYATLENQCYWFSHTICNIVEQEYTCSQIVTGPSTAHGESAENRNDYLPNYSGRCKGFLVSRTDNAVASDLVDYFKKYLVEKNKEGSFLFY